jgi:hypothetical protein
MPAVRIESWAVTFHLANKSRICLFPGERNKVPKI